MDHHLVCPSLSIALFCLLVMNTDITNKQTFVKQLLFSVGTTIGTSIGGCIGMWAGMYSWQRWNNNRKDKSLLPTIGELPDILVKKYKFHADTADRITEDLIAQYGHSYTLEKFRREPQYNADTDILETLIDICK